MLNMLFSKTRRMIALASIGLFAANCLMADLLPSPTRHRPRPIPLKDDPQPVRPYVERPSKPKEPESLIATMYGRLIYLGPNATKDANYALYQKDGEKMVPVCFFMWDGRGLEKYVSHDVKVTGFVKEMKGWTCPLLIIEYLENVEFLHPEEGKPKPPAAVFTPADPKSVPPPQPLPPPPVVKPQPAVVPPPQPVSPPPVVKPQPAVVPPPQPVQPLPSAKPVKPAPVVVPPPFPNPVPKPKPQPQPVQPQQVVVPPPLPNPVPQPKPQPQPLPPVVVPTPQPAPAPTLQPLPPPATVEPPSEIIKPQPKPATLELLLPPPEPEKPQPKPATIEPQLPPPQAVQPLPAPPPEVDQPLPPPDAGRTKSQKKAGNYRPIPPAKQFHR